MKTHDVRWIVLFTMCLLGGGLTPARAALLRYADRVVDAVAGPDQVSGYTDPNVTIGQPSTEHTASTPANTSGGTTNVYSLGQGGSITLGFDQPVINQGASEKNPYGYDLLTIGNAFETVTPEFTYGRFNEPGYIEVAIADESGTAEEWFLILPRMFHARSGLHGDDYPVDLNPSDIVPPTLDESTGMPTASGDSGKSESLMDGVADVVPSNGAALADLLASGSLDDLVLDDPATYAVEGLGGVGIDLSRAVRQSAAGVPVMTGGSYEFVSLDAIDLIRFTDVSTTDQHGEGLGAVTTEIDGVIVLPNLTPVPEPAGLLGLAVGSSMLVRRRR